MPARRAGNPTSTTKRVLETYPIFAPMRSFLLLIALVRAALGLGLFGSIVGVPEDALQAALAGVKSHIVNGLNFQSRIDVKLREITNENPWTKFIPVKRDYKFELSNLAAGEYELTVHSYDFTIRNSRYRVIVNELVYAYEDYLGRMAQNLSSMVAVSPQEPLVVQVLDFNHYYETSQSKLTDMVTKGPLGFIFQNRLYTVLFLGSLVMMVAPYILQWVAPDLAQQIEEAKNRAQSESEEPATAAVATGSSPAAPGVRNRGKPKQRR